MYQTRALPFPILGMCQSAWTAHSNCGLLLQVHHTCTLAQIALVCASQPVAAAVRYPASRPLLCPHHYRDPRPLFCPSRASLPTSAPTQLHHTLSDAHQHHKSTLRPWFDLHLKQHPEPAARERPWLFCKSLSCPRCPVQMLSPLPIPIPLIPRPCTRLIRLPHCLDALGLLSSIQGRHAVCHSMQARCSA